jgi:type I restriction enzyme M protein
MTEQNHKQLGTTLWGIADQLRGAMNADDFRDYMLSLRFLRYLSDNYLALALDMLGAGDTLVVWKLDSLVRRRFAIGLAGV